MSAGFEKRGAPVNQLAIAGSLEQDEAHFSAIDYIKNRRAESSPAAAQNQRTTLDDKNTA